MISDLVNRCMIKCQLEKLLCIYKMFYVHCMLIFGRATLPIWRCSRWCCCSIRNFCRRHFTSTDTVTKVSLLWKRWRHTLCNLHISVQWCFISDSMLFTCLPWVPCTLVMLYSKTAKEVTLFSFSESHKSRVPQPLRLHWRLVESQSFLEGLLRISVNASGSFKC